MYAEQGAYIAQGWKGQDRLIYDREASELAIVAGVRYGKSHFGVVWHHTRCLINKKSKLSLFIAPKYDLLKNNIVPLYVKMLTNAGYVENVHFRVNRSGDLSITYYWGHKVLLRSASPGSISTLVSYTASHVTVDEPGLCDETTPTEVTKRRSCELAQLRQTLYIGTPEDINFYFRKFGQHAVTRIDDKFSINKEEKKLVLHGSSYDNPLLPKDVLESLEREFAWNENLRKAYILGEFVPIYQNRGYDFDPGKQTDDIKVFQDRPLHLCFDFNVTQGKAGGVAWTTIQEHKGDIVFNLENRQNSRTSIDAARAFADQFEELRLPKHMPIEVTGDASGHKRDTRGWDDDYTLIEQVLKKERGFTYVKMKAPEANPSVSMRLAAVNRLCSPSYHSKLLGDKKCTKTINSLTMTTIDPSGNIIKPSGQTHTDYGDALGYGVVELRPIVPYSARKVNYGWA